MSNVFVAMPFHPNFTKIYEESVCPAIKDAALTPFRVDELVGSDRTIIDEIEQGICGALLVFADLTGLNPNVSYEIGFARAIGKPLVLATQDEDAVVPFDLRPRRYIKYTATEDGLRTLRSTLASWFTQSAQVANKNNKNKAPRVTCYGTKFAVPNGNAFWNDLLNQAQRRFYLLGRTNKSWIDKEEQQRKDLARAILRILENGGEVKILSNSGRKIVKAHKRFFRGYVLPLMDGHSVQRSKVNSHLKYAIHKQSNYGAIISDERLVLLPTLNSRNFRDETLVLEIFDSSLPQFANYLSDIDRMIRYLSMEIDIYGWVRNDRHPTHTDESAAGAAIVWHQPYGSRAVHQLGLQSPLPALLCRQPPSRRRYHLCWRGNIAVRRRVRPHQPVDDRGRRAVVAPRHQRDRREDPLSED